ncbi:MAG: hypothetical protein REI64_08415 [Pedobacter sp.]|uniref:hypothetical protein n=1 Tax=Pedobacter sp. TaxID=1411316 RepID=UPI002807A935|nr:hypothetical protein [Pedobacter sp.]MDQ8004806.1 hypothetical protein [Pedobacter sp.]
MLENKKLVLIFFLSIMLLALSCSKKAFSPEEKTSINCLLSEVSRSGDLETFVYNERGEVTVFKNQHHMFLYTYNVSTIEVSTKNYTQIYQLDANKRIVKMTDGSNFIRSFIYNIQGNLIEDRDDRFSRNGDLVVTHSTKYIWSNENMIRRETSVTYPNTPTYTSPFVSTFEYGSDLRPSNFMDEDSNIAIDRALLKFFGKQSKNLLSSMIYDAVNPMSGPNFTYKYAYDFNGNVEKVYTNNSVNPVIYKYSCK